MTKRERESLVRKIAKIEARVAKHNLRRAAESLEREVTDKLSEYV